MELFYLLGMGALAGTLAGLLGIGGGIIIVPVLAWVFKLQGVSDDVLMHVAIGTSLGTIVITSLSSIRAHQKRAAIDWVIFRNITPGILLGGLIGAAIASVIPGRELRILFGIFMLLVAAQMILGGQPRPSRTLPGRIGMNLVGTAIGTVAALMGVGGGSMSVPYLAWSNIDVRRAVATSAAIGFPIAVSGAIGFLISGWDVPHRPPWSLGYINLPAFIGIITASILFAPLGAGLAHRIPPRLLKRVFGFFLLLVGLRMLIGLS
ncbi:MAG: sulfite exporter TauE/SafE family protein [Proteobacteria bacterium]|jgi:uncharacterized protein|nr:sulfite exporter TauE/SafE family protein [Pseudomonadota bacterium]MCG6936101.1 sulfite exporter TauE/SafE family protein [Pseudomonadota bacterium]